MTVLTSQQLKAILNTHPTFTQSEAISNICSPLFKLGINYFSHVRVTTDNSNFSVLAMRPDFVEHYLKKEYYQFDVHNKSQENSTELVIWDNLCLVDESQLEVDDFKEFGHSHTFSVIINSKDYRDCYHFSAPSGHVHMNAFYL